MEKGFRLIKCPDCPKTLRIKITAALYGKTCEVECPSCDARLRFTIPIPADAGTNNDPSGIQESEEDPDDLFGAFKDIFDIFGKKKGQ